MNLENERFMRKIEHNKKEIKSDKQIHNDNVLKQI